MTIPGEEHYALNVDAWLPVASEEEIEKVCLIFRFYYGFFC